jgi:hypothetical protein
MHLPVGLHLPVGYGSCGVAASADCLRHHVSGQAGWSGVDPNRLHPAHVFASRVPHKG